MKRAIILIVVCALFLGCVSCGVSTPTPPDSVTAAKLYYTGVYHTCYKVATESNSIHKIDPIAYCDGYLKTALEEDWFNDQTLPAPPVMVPHVPPAG